MKKKKKRGKIKIALTQENNNIYNNKLNKQYTEATKETEESNYIDINNKRNKALDIKTKDINLSFISNMSENEKKYEKANIKRVKGFTLIQNKYDKECELLK